MANPKPMAVAVVGLGRAGWGLHVQTLRVDPHYHIVSVADMEADRRREARRELGCEPFDDFSQMLKQTRAELIVVASPSHLHAKHAVAAFKAGKHVVLEKPAARTVREFDQIVKASEQANKRLLIHLNYRWNRTFTFVQEVLKSRKLGKLFHIGWLIHSFARRSDWQCLQAHGGGLLNNAGSHMLDQILQLIGVPIDNVMADMKKISDAGDAEDHIKILLRAKNGVTADLELSTSAATPLRQIILLATCGSMLIQHDQAHLKYFDPRQLKPLRLDRKVAAANREYALDRDLPWIEERVPVQGPALRRPACQNMRPPDIGGFYDAVFETVRRRKQFPVKADQVRAMMRVMEQCRKQNPQFSGR